MEIETLEYNTLQYDNQQLDSSLIRINLSDIMKNLRHSLLFSKSSIITVPLLNEPYKKIVITAVHENSDIKFQKSDSSITIQVIEGDIVFRSRSESLRLNQGMILTVGERTPFRIKTMEKTLFLLTILCPTDKETIDYN